MADKPPELKALRLAPEPPIIEPAPRWRQWMNDTDERWANRCLPLLIANEAGWVLRNPYAFRASWSGAASPDALEIEFAVSQLPSPRPVVTHFGYGILTWAVPYLFRTPTGFNLLARGPANMPKDGIAPLEGVIETDWAVSTFTMNWKLTRPGAIEFDEGEPFCMIVPCRRGELESFRPVLLDAADDPELDAAVGRFFESRHRLHLKHVAAEHLPGFEDLGTEWEGDYFRGTTPDGNPAREHQRHLHLAPFVSPRDDPPMPAQATPGPLRDGRSGSMPQQGGSSARR